MKLNLEKLSRLKILLPLIIGAAFLFVLQKLFSEYTYHGILEAAQRVQKKALILSFGLCALNYFVLTLYDTLSFRYVKRDLSYTKIALTAFVSYTFSHNLGFAAVSGSAIRYRLYSAWDISPREIAQVIAFSGTNFWLGLCVLSGISCLAFGTSNAAFLGLPPSRVHMLGIFMLCPVLAYFSLILLRRKPISFRQMEFELPVFSLALTAVVIACIDWLLAAGVLFVLFPETPDLSYPHFLASFFLAQLGAILSHIPGGLGVFETLMVLMLSHALSSQSVLGTLVVFRIVYYFLPFTLGATAFLSYELRSQRREIGKAARFFGRWMSSLVPLALSLSSFVGGIILLISGATPTAADRWWWLENFVPLAFVEASHFLNSIVGASLIVLAWGIRKRVDLAYRMTLALLATGTIVSLTKGFDYEEASVLLITFLIFLPCRKYFYRKASLLAGISAASLMPAILTLMSTIWLGLFSYKHVEYSNELWWQFTFTGDAPRFMRASVGATALLFFVALMRSFRPLRPEPHTPSEEELSTVATVASHSKATNAYLALCRDKALLLSADKSGFIMYQRESRSWIALGDPVGDEATAADLVWEFRELTDQHDGWTVFYQVGADYLPYYLDIGLRLLKLGEEAIVSLNEFSMDGPQARDFRHTLRKLERDGCTFSVRPLSDVPQLLPQLRGISDNWLTDKSTREKGFSVGFFDVEYLKHFPIALIERQGQILAFANIWAGDNKSEASVDLMRFAKDTPNGIMDFLFLHLMLWSKSQGYQTFNMGMAPLSGLDDRPLAPLWSRVGAYAFRHGEHFYNFEGLRKYKEKFHPTWQPKYLASPGGIRLPLILAHLATLISGGIRGIVAK